jgi:hypothetical protein
MTHIISFLTIFTAMLALAAAAEADAKTTMTMDASKSGEKSEVQEFVDLICSYYPRECVKSLQDLAGRHIRISYFRQSLQVQGKQNATAA